MIKRYQRNSYTIIESLEQMIEYLGIDSYLQLHFVIDGGTAWRYRNA